MFPIIAGPRPGVRSANESPAQRRRIDETGQGSSVSTAPLPLNLNDYIRTFAFQQHFKDYISRPLGKYAEDADTLVLALTRGFEAGESHLNILNDMQGVSNLWRSAFLAREHLD